MNCYRIASFGIAAAIMASVFSGCSQGGESTVMPEYVAEYTLSNENADEITRIAASEIEP